MATQVTALVFLLTAGCLPVSPRSAPAKRHHPPPTYSLWPQTDVILTYYVYVPGDRSPESSLWDLLYAPTYAAPSLDIESPEGPFSTRPYVYDSDSLPREYVPSRTPSEYPSDSSDIHDNLPYAPSFKHTPTLLPSETPPLFHKPSSRPVDFASTSSNIVKGEGDLGETFLHGPQDQIYNPSLHPHPASPPYETRKPYIPSSTPAVLASASPNIIRGEGLEKTVPQVFQDNSKTLSFDPKSEVPLFHTTGPLYGPSSSPLGIRPTLTSPTITEGSSSSSQDIFQDRLLPSSPHPQSTPPPRHQTAPATPSPPLFSSPSSVADSTLGPVDPSRSLFTVPASPQDSVPGHSRSPLFSPYAYPTQVPPLAVSVPSKPVVYEAPGHQHPKR